MLRTLGSLGFLLVIPFLTPSTGHASDDNSIEIIASCSPWPPYVVDGAKPGGILVEYVEELLTSFGYKPKIEVYPWKRAIDAAQDGAIDVIFCAESGQANAYGLNYEFPILISDTILLSHREFPLDAGQLWDHRIAVGAGYWYGDVFESRRKDVETIEVVDDLTILRMVASKRADAGLMEKAVADNLILTYPELGDMLHISRQPVATQTFYFATSPETKINIRSLRRHLAVAKPLPIMQQINPDTF
ncbi:transporter substrate-binding domain-containing protein [Thalassospira sp.]|uniref:transporter substrate-binding domain-containing protein n=1 Tax=Thalassospira sp. TaxID=1912094 RepID=UPI0032ED718C